MFDWRSVYAVILELVWFGLLCVFLLLDADMEDYGFEYSEEEPEEQDVDIENQYYNSKGKHSFFICSRKFPFEHIADHCVVVTSLCPVDLHVLVWLLFVDDLGFILDVFFFEYWLVCLVYHVLSESVVT